MTKVQYLCPCCSSVVLLGSRSGHWFCETCKGGGSPYGWSAPSGGKKGAGNGLIKRSMKNDR